MVVRKSILVFLLALFLCPATGLAGEPGPRAQLEASITAALQELASPAFADPANRNAIFNKIEGIVTQRFDFAAFTSRAVGRNWQSFSPDQKKRLTDAFANLLRETYLNKLTGYNGEKVVYTSEILSTDGKRAEVKTTVIIGQRTIPLDYRLQKTSDWKVYDVIVESLSLTRNFRGQFDSILQHGDAEALIRAVEQKAEETRKGNIAG